VTASIALPARRSRLGLILLLGALTALGPFTIDMYLPALPTIGTELASSASTIQLTLTGTLVGLAVGQLVIGPLSDAIGRRIPLLAGTALHVVASLACVFAPDVAVLGVLRVLEGFGAAAGTVVAMAIVRDLYDGRAAATLLSRLILVLGASPVLAPTIGGELLRLTSWRGIFAALAVFSLVLLPLIALYLAESLPPERRRSASVASVARTIGGLAHDRVFVGLVLVAALTMGAVFSYVSGSSFVFQQQYGLDEQQYGLLFAACAVFLIGATQLNAYLLGRMEPRRLLVVAVVAATLSGLLLVAGATAGLGLAGVVVPLWLTVFFVGLAIPNAPALALGRHGEAAGTAAAALGATQFLVGALVAPLVGVLGNDAVAMGVTMASSLVVALVVLVAVVRPWELGDLEPAAELEAVAAD
jgi:MFS transporter, DHA1 family, multidrug resistance protein